MMFPSMTQQAGEWLRGTGPHSDIVLSSRIRYARNIAGFPFVNTANERQQHEIAQICRQHLVDGNLNEPVMWVDLDPCPDLDRTLLVERHLISRQHAKAPASATRAVAIGESETFAIMINEEDHLRIQVLRSGMQLTEALKQIDRIDNHLEGRLDYAYSRRFGYLTACPTNVGTGIRVSVMMHLPALKMTGEIDKVRRAARDMHLAVRGLFGEGSDALGDLYQISNQTTLGRSEQEILADFEHTIVPQIIAYEQQARHVLHASHHGQMLEDVTMRAWGILTHARMIGTDEVLALLSQLRMGVHMGRLDCVDIPTINELFLLCQPAHLQKLSGTEMESSARRIARARLIREKLTGRQ